MSTDRGTLKSELVALVDNAHPRTLPFIDAIIDAMNLHLKKSMDYGTSEDPYANIRASEDFGIPAWMGSLIRAHDKIIRLKQFCKTGELEFETAEDSMLDLCVYLPIVLMLYREEECKTQSST